MRKTLKNLRNRIVVKLVTNKKDYLECTRKPSYMLHKVFDNNFVAICKSKVALKLNKPAYIGICILELGKVLMYELHYAYIQNKYGSNSRLLFTDTDNLCMKLKLKMSMKILAAIKKCLILVIIRLS